MKPSSNDQRTAFISAALRHVRDAEGLAVAVQPQYSLDQAEHLAGFGPECARKALLSVRWVDKILGHGFGEASEAVLAFVCRLDPVAARYDTAGWATRYPTLQQWDPSCRYNCTGTASGRRRQVEQLLQESRQAVDQTVLCLWADGALDAEALL